MKRCKHEFVRVKFKRDPTIYSAWQCEIEEKCTLCGKIHTRTPTHEEHAFEIIECTCKICGMFIKDHRGEGCLIALVKKMNDLEERLQSLERWRNG
jgi:hypothetical protein